VTFPFNPHKGLIIVSAKVWGPLGTAPMRLGLDTGAVGSVISADLLVALGYDPAIVQQRVRIVTASRVESVPRLFVDRINALGQERLQFGVLAHNLPPSTSVDGLLGLDFFRGLSLTIDFRAGTIELL
jgi:predicted aspartyl protease